MASSWRIVLKYEKSEYSSWRAVISNLVKLVARLSILEIYRAKAKV